MKVRIVQRGEVVFQRAIKPHRHKLPPFGEVRLQLASVLAHLVTDGRLKPGSFEWQQVEGGKVVDRFPVAA